MSERAFPVENPRISEQRGMELRDYFAAKIVASGIITGGHASPEVLCKAAYEIADMMMKARGK